MFAELLFAHVVRVPRVVVDGIAARRQNALQSARAMSAPLLEMRTCTCGARFEVFAFAPDDAVCGSSCSSLNRRRVRR